LLEVIVVPVEQALWASAGSSALRSQQKPGSAARTALLVG
jgi:hypothetical protein